MALLEQTTDWRDSMKVAREKADGRLRDARAELKTVQETEKALRAEIDELMVALGQKRAPKGTKVTEAPKPRKPRKAKAEVAPTPPAAEPVTLPQEAPTYPEGAEVRCPRISPKACGWAGKLADTGALGECPRCGCNTVAITQEA